MKFVLSDELEKGLRSLFRKKGDLSKIAEYALQKLLDTNTPEDILAAIEDVK